MLNKISYSEGSHKLCVHTFVQEFVGLETTKAAPIQKFVQKRMPRTTTTITVTVTIITRSPPQTFARPNETVRILCNDIHRIPTPTNTKRIRRI